MFCFVFKINVHIYYKLMQFFLEHGFIFFLTKLVIIISNQLQSLLYIVIFRGMNSSWLQNLKALQYGNQPLRWSNDPLLLVFISLHSPCPAFYWSCLCEQQNMAEEMICHFEKRHHSFHLAPSLSHHFGGSHGISSLVERATR